MLNLGFEGLSPKDTKIRWYSQMVRQWIANPRFPSSSLGTTSIKIVIGNSKITKFIFFIIKMEKLIKVV